MRRLARWSYLSSVRLDPEDGSRSPLIFTPGDWPPSGVRVGRVAALVPDGCRTEQVARGESPVDALLRAVARRPFPGPWPVGVVSRAQGHDAGPDATLFFVSALGPTARADALGLDASVAAQVIAESRRVVAEGPHPAIFTEVRHHVFSKPSFFHCRLLERGNESVILEYITRRDGAVKGLAIPKGSRTLARYVTGAPFVPWRIEGPTGDHVCSVIHLAERVHVRQDRVDYHDLLLDVFILPGIRPEVIDQDDLELAVARGLIDVARAEELLRLADELAADPRRALEGLPI